VGWVDAIILGLVQGLTEFLPVSSSAHLRIVGEFLGTGADPGAAFTAIIQLGTETAVLIYFMPDIAHIVSSWFKALFGRIPRNDPNARLGWFIIVGSIPIVVLGLIFQTQIETVLRSLWIVATTLIVFGILLGIADYLGAKTLRLREMTWRNALLLGLAQALALIPGVSRSGATIGAGRALGFERPAAARHDAADAGCRRGRRNCRLRRDRVLHALHLEGFVPAVRDLPDRARRPADCAPGHGHDRRLIRRTRCR